jgi:opacity protein-like surface antigen
MRAGVSRRWTGALALAILILPRLAMGDPTNAGVEEKQSFFQLGPQSVGLDLGYGYGVALIASGAFESRDVRALLVLPYWQLDVTRKPLRPAWYKGRLTIRSEPTFIVNFSPRTGGGYGFALLLRYRMTYWDRVAPYFEIGAGPLYLDFDIRDQADGLAFIPQIGAGVSWRARDRVSLDLGFRFVHISNAYTQLPNGGIDMVQVHVGAGYWFD